MKGGLCKAKRLAEAQTFDFPLKQTGKQAESLTLWRERQLFHFLVQIEIHRNDVRWTKAFAPIGMGPNRTAARDIKNAVVRRAVLDERYGRQA